MLSRVHTYCKFPKHVDKLLISAINALIVSRFPFTTWTPSVRKRAQWPLTTRLNHHASGPTLQERPFRHNDAPLSSLLPPPPSPHHNTQRSFLVQSQRTGLNPASTVFTGTRYEYLTQSSLRRLGVEVARVGGTGDRGVDLVGFWWLPQWSKGSTGSAVAFAAAGTPDASVKTTAETRDDTSDTGSERHDYSEKIKILVQCKRISPTVRASKSIGPSVVREMEGAFHGAPSGWRGDGVVGLLVSTRAATKGVIEGLKRSERALGWVLLEETEGSPSPSEIAETETETDDREPTVHLSEPVEQEGPEPDLPPAFSYNPVKGRVKQILWNQKAKELGLEGLDVVKRFALDAEQDAGDEVVLMWKGKAVAGLPDDVL